MDTCLLPSVDRYFDIFSLFSISLIFSVFCFYKMLNYKSYKILFDFIKCSVSIFFGVCVWKIDSYLMRYRPN